MLNDCTHRRWPIATYMHVHQPLQGVVARNETPTQSTHSFCLCFCVDGKPQRPTPQSGGRHRLNVTRSNAPAWEEKYVLLPASLCQKSRAGGRRFYKRQQRCCAHARARRAWEVVVVRARSESPIAATYAECFYLLDFIAKSVAFGSPYSVHKRCGVFQGKNVFFCFCCSFLIARHVVLL